jgi:glycosyltransferase involved in cell wall biosynthesis
VEAEDRHTECVIALAKLSDITKALVRIVMEMLGVSRSDLASRVVFVVAGKAGPKDVKELQAWGMTVFANLPDEELVSLYAAADIYANFSRWEGYNLGSVRLWRSGYPLWHQIFPHIANSVFSRPTTRAKSWRS